MSTADIWFIIVTGSVGTFALRFSFVAVLGKFGDLPPIVMRGLRLVPAAVLPALVTPALTYVDGGFDPFQSRLVAGFVAAVVAWRTRKLLAVLVSGMVALWIVEAVL